MPNIKILLIIVLPIFMLDSNCMAQEVIPKRFYTSNGLRIQTESVYLKGSNDTIYSFIRDEPIYRIILKKGRLIKTTLLHPLSSMTTFDSKGRIAQIEYWDSSGGVLNGLNIKFSFWKSGKIWACNSSFQNISCGTNFMFTSKGRMSLVVDSDMGKRIGQFWEETKNNGYRFSSYNNNVLNGTQITYNRRDKIIIIREFKNGELISSAPH